METTVNGEPVPETSGNALTRLADVSGAHEACDAEIRRLRAALERTGPFPGSDAAAVPAGELAAFGVLMERTEAALAAEKNRADEAEAKLTAIAAYSRTAMEHASHIAMQRTDGRVSTGQILAIITGEPS